MTAKAESRYHTLLQVAAGKRLRDDTAALNKTYTASVTAVETETPSANHGSICVILLTSLKRITSDLTSEKNLRLAEHQTVVAFAVVAPSTSRVA
jgi:hypothetical protein